LAPVWDTNLAEDPLHPHELAFSLSAENLIAPRIKAKSSYEKIGGGIVPLPILCYNGLHVKIKNKEK
jgi:hypothetical protein